MGQWNAYESWLGLSLGGRAPSYYELLGLSPGAPQPAVLRQAVLQRMAKVRPYQTGKHGEEATRLLNELAEAAVVLGDPRRRAAYDASLAGQKLTQEQSSALEGGDWWESGGSLVDPFLERLVGEMQQQTSPLLIQPKRRQPLWLWPAVGGVGLAVAFLFILIISSRGGGDEIDRTEEVGQDLQPPFEEPAPSQDEPAPPALILQRPKLLAYPATPVECQTAQQQWADFLQMDVRRTTPQGIELALIPAGQFWMGSPEWETGRDPVTERAVAVVLARPFYLGVTEVTRAQWQAVTGSSRASWENDGGTPSWPATHVNWGDAQAFCQRLNERERNAGSLPAGWTYSLPTDAQWEFACRAGSVARFCSGDSNSTLRKFAFSLDGFRSGLQDVALLQSNAYGLFDMHGNAQEWCLDWHIGQLRGGLDPVLLEHSGAAGRVLRGGNSDREPSVARSAIRYWAAPGSIDRLTGFRIALVPDETAISGETPATIPELPPLTREQTADESRTCAALADDPTHSRWLIRPGELGGAEWLYHFEAESPFMKGRTPLGNGGYSGVVAQTPWSAKLVSGAFYFQLPAIDGMRLVWRVGHRGDLYVRANGHGAGWHFSPSAGQVEAYRDVPLSAEEQAWFHTGENGVSISCVASQEGNGANHFDLGLRLVPKVAESEGGVSEVPPVAEPPTEATYLSDLSFIEPNNSWGPIERDSSIGGVAAGDGRPLTLNRITYAKGLGVHAPSSVAFDLNGEYDRFEAFVGLHEDAGTRASVVFQVYGDRMLLYDSGHLGRMSETHHIDVSVQGVLQLRLVVTDGGDGNHSDHGCWADAKLLRATPLQ